MLKHDMPLYNRNIDSNQINYKQCVKVGNALTVTALVFMLSCIFVSFIFEQHFSLTNQVIAHIGTIIFAGVVKVGYVIRCIGAHGLGHTAF